MNKKGQFYLIGVVVIVGLVVGFLTVVNYTKKGNPIMLSHIKSELGIEAVKVLDYDEFNNDNKFEEFASDYSDFIGKDVEIYFVIVDATDMESIEIESYRYNNGVKETIESEVDTENNKIIVTIDFGIFEFELKPGKNFHFIIFKEEGGEKHIITN